MKRAIVMPAVLPASALADLKQWLGISTAYDDALLTALLRSALEMCEAFTGLVPVEIVAEEVLAARSGWLLLATRPVQSIASVEAVALDGTRTAMAPDNYELDLDADGGGRVRLLKRGNTTRIAVRFTAGIAPDWDTLPDGLRHGLLRLAAHEHRERETQGASQHPPAAVAALWRPWRRMRLA